MTPSLTIAIPVYERTFGFVEALQSAMAVKGCKEILVTDDVSSHSEFEHICGAQQDPRIRYVRNDSNRGVFGNWNQGARLASGDFVAILCSDDLVAPEIYDWFLEAYNQMPDLDVFFGAFAVFNKSVADSRSGRSYPTGPMSSKKLLEEAVERDAAFPVLSVIRRSSLLKFPFVEKPHSGNDSLWIYSNASSFKLYAHSKPLSYWRRHANQDSITSQSITTDNWPLMYAEIAKQLRKYGSPKARRSKERAVGIILSWLLNDKNKNGYYKRLLGEEAKENLFLSKAKSLADENWLLSGLLKSTLLHPFYYNVGRLYRKLKIYPYCLKSY